MGYSPDLRFLIVTNGDARSVVELRQQMEADHLLVFVLKAFLQDTVGLKIRLEDHFLINSLGGSRYGRE